MNGSSLARTTCRLVMGEAFSGWQERWQEEDGGVL